MFLISQHFKQCVTYRYVGPVIVMTRREYIVADTGIIPTGTSVHVEVEEYTRLDSYARTV